MTEVTYPQVRRALQAGELDDYLEELTIMLNNRRQLNRAVRAGQLLRNLQPGDTIVISSTCKPRMLANARVIYRGRRASRLLVELQQTYSPKWFRGNVIRIPESLVAEVIHKEEKDV